MKKIICALVIVSLFSFIWPAKAITQQEARIESIKQQISIILAKVIELQKLLLEMIKQENQEKDNFIVKGTDPVPEEVKEEIIIKTTNMSEEIKKEIEVKRNCLYNGMTSYCNIDVVYKENDIEIEGKEITVSSDDQGEFVGRHCLNGENANSDGTQKKGNPLTCTGKHFQYFPEKAGNRIISVKINGASTTISCEGKK
jgi:hypothetical protein